MTLSPELLNRMNAVKARRNATGCNVHYIRLDGRPDCFSFATPERANRFADARRAEGCEIIAATDPRAIKDATYAKQAVRDISTNPNAAARKRMAQLVLERGNYDAGGMAVWQTYAALGAPFNHEPE